MAPPKFFSAAERMRRLQGAMARNRRESKWNARVEWYGQQVAQNINIGMVRRLKTAAQLLRDKVVLNLAVPVRKYRTKYNVRVLDELSGEYDSFKRSTTVVDPASRSKPGEFPRADTTRLMKDIFWDYDENAAEFAGIWRARVGTTLDYGLQLELHMNRSFLRRTLFEDGPRLTLILVTDQGGPLPGQVS